VGFLNILVLIRITILNRNILRRFAVFECFWYNFHSIEDGIWSSNMAETNARARLSIANPQTLTIVCISHQ